MSAWRPFLQRLTLLLKDKLDLNLPCKETLRKQTDLAPPANIPTSGMRLGWVGQCLDDPVWTCQWLREDRTVSGGVREPEAIALAPVGDRADSRVLSGPLEGSQKLARRSGAHPLVVSRPGSRQESI